MSRATRSKHFIPLESNPESFNPLIHSLGVSPQVSFVDIYSLSPEFLEFTPRPCLALVLVFPDDKAFQQLVKKEDDENGFTEYQGKGEEEEVVWYKQTIGNACGTYGILHAISNGPSRNHILPDSPIATLLAKCIPLAPSDRALALESSDALESSHAAAATQGQTSAPEATARVEHHYLCLVPSSQNSVYLMDGMRKGPIDLGIKLEKEQDMLDERVVRWLTDFLNKSGKIEFSLMGLVVGAE